MGLITSGCAGFRRDEPSDIVVLSELMLEVQGTQRTLRERRLEERMRALSNVQEALSRLRGVSGVRDLREGDGDVCSGCELRPRDPVPRLERADRRERPFEGDPEGAEALRDVVVAEPRNSTTCCSRPRCCAAGRRLCRRPADDPRAYRPLIEATGTRSYVAAPIMPEARVIGFLHADCRSPAHR